MIIFKKIRYKNFLSTGNRFIEVALNKHKTTLLVGKNASGKSTILDALVFSLFGKPFRDINKPQLVNSINGKDCLVEIEFSIGTNNYLVRRGIKPNIFEIVLNGTVLNKDSDSMDFQKYLENTILKLSYKSFTQIVILGSSSFVPFMQLPAADRRAIIEDLLDITIFSAMNGLLKEKLSVVKENIRNHNTQIEIIKSKIQIQTEHIESLESKQALSVDVIKKDTDAKRKQIEECNQRIAEWQSQIELLTDQISDKTAVAENLKKLEKYNIKGRDKLSRETAEFNFFKNNDDCPTCQREIDDEFKSKKILEKESTMETITRSLSMLQTELDKANERRVEITNIVNQIKALNTNIQKESSVVLGLNHYLEEVGTTTGVLVPDHNIDAEKRKLADYRQTHQELVESLHLVEGELRTHDLASSMLKDTGIKTKIIKQYLPAINKLINKYLSDLNFYASFNLDENFKEEIKSRNRDTFTYGSFSEGQKMRVDLALLFTWREIAKMKNSVNTNLLFLDEIFDSSLDHEGTEEFSKLLKTVDGNFNTFLISHKTDQLWDKFNAVLQFELKTNFTTMKSN